MQKKETSSFAGFGLNDTTTAATLGHKSRSCVKILSGSSDQLALFKIFEWLRTLNILTRNVGFDLMTAELAGTGHVYKMNLHVLLISIRLIRPHQMMDRC